MECVKSNNYMVTVWSSPLLLMNRLPDVFKAPNRLNSKFPWINFSGVSN